MPYHCHISDIKSAETTLPYCCCDLLRNLLLLCRIGRARFPSYILTVVRISRDDMYMEMKYRLSCQFPVILNYIKSFQFNDSFIAAATFFARTIASLRVSSSIA